MNRFAQSVSSRPRALVAIAAIGLTTAFLASPAVASAAQPAIGVLQTTVHYNYRDLETDQGTRALYERITSAAKSVCPGYDSRDLAAFAGSRECQRQAVARAIGQIGNGRLAALYSRTTMGRG